MPRYDAALRCRATMPRHDAAPRCRATMRGHCALIAFLALSTSASADAFRISVVRRLWDEGGAQPSKTETRFLNALTASGERFHEKLMIEQWRNGRKESEQRFVVASDGKVRRSYPEAVDQQGKRRGVVDFAPKRSLARMPFDPVWLTDSSPLLSAARDESRLDTVLPNLSKEVEQASQSKEIVLIRESASPPRRWKGVFGNGSVPKLLEEFDGERVLQRIRATPLGSEKTHGAFHVSKAVREMAASTGESEKRSFVEVEVRDLEFLGNTDEVCFEVTFPEKTLVEDRTKSESPIPASKDPSGGGQ